MFKLYGQAEQLKAELAHKKSVQLLISAAKKRYRREKQILGWWVGCCKVGSLLRRM